MCIRVASGLVRASEFFQQITVHVMSFCAVRPPPLTWSITKTTNTFNISWVPPEMLKPSAWEFHINYNECAKSTVRDNNTVCVHSDTVTKIQQVLFIMEGHFIQN